MSLTSSGVDIRGLPGGGLPFLLPGCQKRVFRRYIVCSLHPKLCDTSATRAPASRSQNAVFLYLMANTPIPHRPRIAELPRIDFFIDSGGFVRFH